MTLGSPIVSVIKVDVEGGEYGILLGSKRTIAACRPCILIEWYKEYLENHGTAWASILKFAEELDYSVYAIPDGVAVRNLLDLRVSMLFRSNFILMPNTAAENLL